MSELKLPELPEPTKTFNILDDLFTAAQMLAIRDSGIRYGMSVAAETARIGVEWDPGRSADYREGYFQGLRDAETAIRAKATTVA